MNQKTSDPSIFGKVLKITKIFTKNNYPPLPVSLAIHKLTEIEKHRMATSSNSFSSRRSRNGTLGIAPHNPHHVRHSRVIANRIKCKSALLFGQQLSNAVSPFDNQLIDRNSKSCIESVCV